MPMIHEVMYAFSRWACVVGLLVLPVLACSDTGGVAAGGSGGSAGASGSGGAAGAGGERGVGGQDGTVTMLTTTYEVLANGLTVPLAGVRVCQLDEDNCETSTEAGRVALVLPANIETGYTAEKEGYGPYLTTFTTGDAFPGTSSEPMHTPEQLEAIAAPFDVSWTDGMLATLAYPQLTGATVSLVGVTGTPLYLDPLEGYTSELDSSIAGGWWPQPFGMAAFAGLSDGEHVVEFGGAAADCGPSRWGWPGDAPNRVRVLVRAGYITTAGVHCDQP
jgi:hypothetical protein